MRNFRYILLGAILLLLASVPASAQRGRFRGHLRYSSWSMRWHPNIGSHFGLKDSCWQIFLSEIPADSAAVIRNEIGDIRQLRAKIDTLHIDYRAALRADDTAGARMIWIKITDNFEMINDDWQVIKPIAKQYRDLIKDLYHDCGKATAKSTIGLLLTPVIPNPATTSAHFSYTTDASVNVLIQIFDRGGNTIKTVFDGNAAVGPHDVQLDLGGMQSGAYLLRIQAGANISTEKFVIRN